jgi:hypothetical protein
MNVLNLTQYNRNSHHYIWSKLQLNKKVSKTHDLSKYLPNEISYYFSIPNRPEYTKKE